MSVILISKLIQWLQLKMFCIALNVRDRGEGRVRKEKKYSQAKNGLTPSKMTVSRSGEKLKMLTVLKNVDDWGIDKPINSLN